MEHVIDAKNRKLGRIATEVSVLLQGKHKADYQTYKPGEDTVVVKNAKFIEISGRKATDKIYHHHTGYPGGLREQTYNQIVEKKGHEEVLRKAVFGMLPDNRLRNPRMKRLTIED